MSKLKNAPLIEVIFELKWGKTSQKGHEFTIEFPQEEQALMPGKFQIHAETDGFGFLEVLENNPPIPHVVRYRYRQKPEGYPLYQLGNGIFTINQIDTEEYEYDWDAFKTHIERGIKLFEKSYPLPIQKLPVIDIQLRYRDVILAQDDECILTFIAEKLNLGTLTLPPELTGDDYINTECPTGSFTLQVGCEKPNGQIICQINQGLKDGKKAFILDFIIISKVNVFAEITSKNLMDWCKEAHDHHQTIFNAICRKELLETFQ
jgi:uncharacterized protein (TIGR04255 family)